MEQINADLNIQDTTALKRKANENDMKPQEPSSIHRKEKWRRAIQEVLFDQTEKSKKLSKTSVLEQRDLLGEGMTRLLNTNPMFSSPQSEGCEEEYSFQPILCSKNIQRLKEMFNEVSKPSQALIFLTKLCEEYFSWMIRDCQSWKLGVRTLGCAVLCAAFLFAFMMQKALCWTYQVVWISAVHFLPVLVDVDELIKVMPVSLRGIWQATYECLRWIDATLVWGRQIAGREWNKNSYSFSNLQTDSQRESLRDCPPPKEEFPGEWSRLSIDHVTSINFCYLMIKNDFILSQARKKRKAFKKAKPRNLIEIGELLIDNIPDDYIYESIVNGEPNNVVDFMGEQNILGERWSDEEFSETSGSCSKKRGLLQNSVDSDDDYDNASSLTFAEDVMSVGIDLHSESSFNSTFSLASDVDSDLNWVDVGTRIGLRLLNSEHVQRAVASQDTAERIKSITRNVEKKFGKDERKKRIGNDSSSILSQPIDSDPLKLSSTTISPNIPIAIVTTPSRAKVPPPKPVHAMWTSASSVAQSPSLSISTKSKNEAESDTHSTIVHRYPVIATDATDSDFSPPSPNSARDKLKSTVKIGGASSEITQKKDNSKSVYFNSEPCFLAKFEVSPPMELNGDCMQARRSCHEPISLEVVNEEGVNITITGPPSLSKRFDLPEGFSAAEELESRQYVDSSVRTFPATRRTTQTVSISSSTLSKPAHQRPILQAGVKMVVPIFPMHPGVKLGNVSSSFFQMGTVVSCKRVNIRPFCESDSRHASRRHTNCLSVTVILDRCFLRDGKFTEMTMRIMDDWEKQYVPRHSKFPIGACVATSFGVGVLVGWRVEDDCHIVRSLWQRRGAGSANAYLNRQALQGVVEAAVGFAVQTTLGKGDVLSYVSAGRNFKLGRYFVHIKEQGPHDGQVLEFNRCDILSCQGPEFIPVIELIREASQYQIQVDNYESAIRHQMHKESSPDKGHWKAFSKGFQTIWDSFLLALEEDREFDEGVNRFFTNIIDFLDRLDKPETEKESMTPKLQNKDCFVETIGIDLATSTESGKSCADQPGPGFWLLNSIFISRDKPKDESSAVVESTVEVLKADLLEAYKKANSVIRALMKTVAIARASSKDQPNLRLGLSIFYEFLLFLRTIVKVHQKNVSPTSLVIWKRTMTEISATLGPSKERIEKVIKGIIERMERQGNKAKVRILRFVDLVLLDERFLFALEKGEWDIFVQSVEDALVQSRIVEEDSRMHYRTTLKYIIRLLSSASSGDESASIRNTEKMAQLGKALKWIASPRRSVLKLLRSDFMMEFLERVFVRVFRNEPAASRMITIHASNIHTLRQLRMLKDFTIAAKLWIPMLDAADEEFRWAVTNMPDNFKDMMVPMSKLFSLCVAQFHRIGGGDLTADWLNFLMQDDAVKLIQQLDEKLILYLESFCKDIKEFMVVLPYYRSLDDDILNLMDEVDIDELFREASEAFVDAEKLPVFIREKSTLAIERFLDYLPKMSIPVERRDLGDGWVFTCRGEDGGDLTLSDVTVERENLICKVLGGDSIFFPVLVPSIGEVTNNDSLLSEPSVENSPRSAPGNTEISILDQIRELLLNAQLHGCWQSGFGGVGQQPTDRYVANILQGLPVSSVLNCGIELWRNLEIDDDELLEIAIRDVSFQIKLQKEREEVTEADHITCNPPPSKSDSKLPGQVKFPKIVAFPESPRRRFNPRVDSTVLYLEMKKLTLNLDMFHFRFEKDERRTIFDPIFEGFGSLCVQNVFILLRVECKKGRIMKMGTSVPVPVLQLQELDIRLKRVKFTVKDTGIDWLLNRAVKQFQEKLTEIIEANLNEQVHLHIHAALENLNSHFSVNPDLLLGLLGISIDDLEEGEVVWV